MSEITDPNGKVLNIGDEVHVVKDLKVKGDKKGLKVGTKLKIRDINPFDDASIEVKISKSTTICIKPEFVKKSD